MECFEDADFLRMMEIKPEVCESVAECGHRSFVIMAGAFDKRKVDAHVLSYEGPFGVGYGVATFEGGEADPNRNYLDQFIAFENKARRRAYEARRRVRQTRPSQRGNLRSDASVHWASERSASGTSEPKSGHVRFYSRAWETSRLYRHDRAHAAESCS